MRKTRHLLAGAASAIAIAALPLNLESIASGSLELASAFAKSDHSGGNGNGGGNGGHGHSGEHGKPGHGCGGGAGVGAGSPGRLRTITGQETHGSKHKVGETKFARSTKSHKKTDDIETAALPDEAPLAGPKAKNLNARLAGLHSLNRNFRAYLNSQDPRMASIRDFVLASANLDIANEKLDKAQGDFNAALTDADIVAFDDSSIYDNHPTLGELRTRLDTLEGIDPSTLSPAQAAALEQEKTDLSDLLSSGEATALGNAEDAVDAASVGTDDDALKAALLDAANKNRVAQYGDDYVNDDVLNWAKNVLGVGDAVGKIDEVRGTLTDDR
jgi:hypothetical protein